MLGTSTMESLELWHTVSQDTLAHCDITLYYGVIITTLFGIEWFWAVCCKGQRSTELV